MRISELKKILETIENEHGDLVVTQYQWNDSLNPHVTEGVSVETVRPHYSRGKNVVTYVINRFIRKGGYGGGSMFEPKYTKEILHRPLEKVAFIYYNKWKGG